MALTSEADRRLTDRMGRAQSGDSDAYRALLIEVATTLRPFVITRVGSVEAAEDVLQEILLSIHAARHTYRSEKPFAPWMYAIARRRIADFWRSQSRRVAVEPLDSLGGFGEPAASGERDGRPDGPSLLDLLSGRQRELVKLLKVDGLSMQEAAGRLNMTESAVRVAAHRAYKIFKKKYQDMINGHAEDD